MKTKHSSSGLPLRDGQRTSTRRAPASTETGEAGKIVRLSFGAGLAADLFRYARQFKRPLAA
jgi:hypothetical protein